MPRKSKLTTEEIQEAEKAKDERVESRNRGYSKMAERDRGWHNLSNGTTILWHVDREPLPGEALHRVPEDSFVLVIGGKNHLFDGEEFRKWVRWV